MLSICLYINICIIEFICIYVHIIYIYIYCHLIYDKSANEIQWGKTGFSINDNGVRDPMNKN